MMNFNNPMQMNKQNSPQMDFMLNQNMNNQFQNQKFQINNPNNLMFNPNFQGIFFNNQQLYEYDE